VVLGELRGPEGGVIVATNHSGSNVASTLRLPDEAARAEIVEVAGASNAELKDGAIPLALDAFGAIVVAWRR
jgi:hypothetical protein